MSSFVRRMQRAIPRSKKPGVRGVLWRGSKLGVKNPGRLKRKPKVKVRPTAEQRLINRTALKAKMKARVAVIYRQPTRAQRQEDHANKMLWKKERS